MNRTLSVGPQDIKQTNIYIHTYTHTYIHRNIGDNIGDNNYNLGEHWRTTVAVSSVDPCSNLFLQSKWRTLPSNIMHLVHDNLTRDDVVRTAHIWPECVTDPYLQAFVPGGMPVCRDCEDQVLDSIRAVLRQYDDPTLVFADVEFDSADSQVFEEVLVLFVRMVVGCAPGRCQCATHKCYLCYHKPETSSCLKSGEWNALLHRYVASLAEAISSLCQDDLEEEFFEGLSVEKMSTINDTLLPYICHRCGDIECKGSKSCRWIFGEENAFARLKADMLREKQAILDNKL